MKAVRTIDCYSHTLHYGEGEREREREWRLTANFRKVYPKTVCNCIRT